MQSNTKTMRLQISFIAGVTAAALLGTGCSQGDAQGPTAEPVVEVAMGSPALTAIEDTVTAVGTIDANERVELQPEAPGLIRAILFTEGERVEQGDRLFQLDASKEEAAVSQAQAEKVLAQSNLERAQSLVGTKAISRQEVDKLASELAVKSAVLEVQEENLSDRVVIAPFAGVVGPRLVSPGQYVHTGTPLGTLVDQAIVKVRCGLPERALAHVQVGQTGRIRVNAYPDRTFVGKVDLISPEVDVATRTAEVRLRVPNPEGLLKPGMFARVEIVAAVRERALVIPEGALVPSLEAFSVYVVQEERARLRPVQVGVRGPGEVEILQGLKEGDRLVISGTQKLVDGMKVTSAQTAPGEEEPRETAG